MSTVGDDELPPWLLEDTSDVQVDAGSSTIIPAPEEPVAEVGGKASTSQNQPNIAATDDVIVDTPVSSVDPLAGTQTTAGMGTSAATGAVTSATKAPTTAKSGSGKTSIAKAGGTKSGKTSKKATRGKKPNKPTMVRYKVRKGDNLTDIAKRSNTTVAQIRRDSRIKGDLIYPGQTIMVRFTPKNYKKSVKGGKNTRGSKTTRGKNYTVRRGETISGIAKKNGISTAALLKANNMKPSDAVKMRAGKKLIIPKR